MGFLKSGKTNIGPAKARSKEEDMLHIKFEYRDEMSNWEWRQQECYMSSVEQCKEVYGLGVDCDYRIISVEEVKK